MSLIQTVLPFIIFFCEIVVIRWLGKCSLLFNYNNEEKVQFESLKSVLKNVYAVAVILLPSNKPRILAPINLFF